MVLDSSRVIVLLALEVPPLSVALLGARAESVVSSAVATGAAWAVVQLNARQARPACKSLLMFFMFLGSSWTRSSEADYWYEYSQESDPCEFSCVVARVW